MPSLLIDGALYLISGSIQKRCGFSIYDVSPIKDVPYMRIPIMFLHGLRDVECASHAQCGLARPIRSHRQGVAQH